MKIENDNQLKNSYLRLQELAEAYGKAMSIDPATMHPLLYKAMIDSLNSMMASVNEDINDYELERAYKRYYENEKHLWGLKAFKLGWQAAREGQTQAACPYIAQRQTVTGLKTFGHAYRDRWMAGYNSFRYSRPEGIANGALA